MLKFYVCCFMYFKRMLTALGDFYMQTGSGKTYTMMGEINEVEGNLYEDCGITPRIFEYLFARIRKVSRIIF